MVDLFFLFIRFLLKLRVPFALTGRRYYGYAIVTLCGESAVRFLFIKE